MRSFPNALVVSPDVHVRHLIVAALGELGCRTFAAATHDDALAHASLSDVDLLIVDVDHPAFEDALVCELRGDQPGLNVLYLVGRVGLLTTHAFERKLQDAFLRKPFRLDDLRDIVSSWLEERWKFTAFGAISLN
jgi:DNA-binding NtrC family response regulator